MEAGGVIDDFGEAEVEKELRSFYSSTPNELGASMSAPALWEIAKQSREDERTPRFRPIARGSWERMRELIKVKVTHSKNDSGGLCAHPHHCVQNACLGGFVRTFSAAFAARSMLVIANKMMRKGVRLQAFSDALFRADTTRFALVFALMSFLYKATLCTLRRVFQKNHCSFYAVAAAIGASVISLSDASTLKICAQYGVVRAVADGLAVLSSRGLLPLKVPMAAELAFILPQIVIVPAYVLRNELMDASYRRAMIRAGGFHRFNHLRDVFQHGFDSGDFKSCVPHLHTDSHWQWWFRQFILVFKLSFKMYFPVHFLPPLLFNPSKVCDDFFYGYVVKKMVATLRSCAFLADFCTNGKIVFCLLREWLQRDPLWLYFVVGIVSGLSIFIENAKRRANMALYCLPRAVNIVLRMFSKERFPGFHRMVRSRLFATVNFQLAMAIWMVVFNLKERSELNSFNVGLLSLVFGSKH